MSHRTFKERLYGEFGRIGSALASDKRLELVDLLAQGPRHVEALAAEADMTVANVSQHLQILRRAHLVETDREGTRIFYRLADQKVVDLWLSLRAVAEAQLAEVGQLSREYASDSGDGVEVSRADLEKKLERGEAYVIDVRPELEYASGHLPGAFSLPVEDLPERLQELPRDRLIVAYCRGRYCLFADEAVALLRSHGFDAHRMEGGWPEWSSEGRARQPVQTP
ncbi:MAG: metalloregulator ArsR/SmtB family transcription factor [Dehalococcoidia bacterium]